METMLTDRQHPSVKSVAAISLVSAVSAYLVRRYFCNRLFGLSGIVRSRGRSRFPMSGP